MYQYYRSSYPVQDQRFLGFALLPLAASAFLGGLVGGGIGGAIGSRPFYPPIGYPGFGYPGVGYPGFGYPGFGAPYFY